MNHVKLKCLAHIQAWCAIMSAKIRKRFTPDSYLSEHRARLFTIWKTDDITAVGTTVEDCSYDAVWSVNRTHAIPNAERMCYVLAKIRMVRHQFVKFY